MPCESANALAIPPVQTGVHTREPGPGTAPTVTLEAPNTAVPTRSHEGNTLAWKDGREWKKVVGITWPGITITPLTPRSPSLTQSQLSVNSNTRFPVPNSQQAARVTEHPPTSAQQAGARLQEPLWPRLKYPPALQHL